MAASASDLFMEVGHPGSATALGGTGYTVGDASITVGATTNWPTTTGVCFSIYEVTTVGGVSVMTAGSYNEYYGTVASATSITNVSHVTGSGTDKNYSAGASTIVTILVSDGRENRLAQGMVIEHKQTGKHSAVTVDSLVVADGGNIEVDHILEAASAHGVVVDGLLIKDGALATVGSAPITMVSNPYKFRVYRNASYTGLTDAAATVVDWDAESFDVNNNFNTTSNQYTIPVTGYYHFTFSCRLSGTAVVGVGGYLVGGAEGTSIIANTVHAVGSASSGHVIVSGLFQCTAGDLISAKIYADTTGTFAVVEGADSTYFSGYLMSV